MKDITELLRDESTWRDGWQTRDGSPVEIVAYDVRIDRCYCGKILEAGGACRWETWGPDGQFFDECSSHWDLVPRLKKYRGWVNVYPRNCICGRYESRQDADRHADVDRIACIEIEFEEGQGLEETCQLKP